MWLTEDNGSGMLAERSTASRRRCPALSDARRDLRTYRQYAPPRRASDGLCFTLQRGESSREFNAVQGPQLIFQ
ncbi:hypothetical protein RR46_11273 [Papilio xuthus]|uniref:Uncharacterized protein n=1 Tax=Papilio xuthus TaxID=66420 RepID=A0A194PXU9_PAPXU|nr:hypothetical protein RR46_11273 [Papilio xuthus]